MSSALSPPGSDCAERRPAMRARISSGRGESSATSRERRARPVRMDGSHSSSESVTRMVRLSTAVVMYSSLDATTGGPPSAREPGEGAIVKLRGTLRDRRPLTAAPGTVTRRVSGARIWYAPPALGSVIASVLSERRCRCACVSIGCTAWLKPVVSFWYATRLVSSPLVALLPSRPTLASHTSPVRTITIVGGSLSGVRPRVEWFCSACSLPPAAGSVSEPTAAAAAGLMRSSGRTDGGLRERTSDGCRTTSTTSSRMIE